VLYYEKALETRDIYTLHDLKTVPYICTSKQELKRDQTEEFYKISDKWFLKREDAHETQVQLDYINKRLNTEVALKLPLTTVLFKNFMLFGVLTFMLNMLVWLRP